MGLASNIVGKCRNYSLIFWVEFSGNRLEQNYYEILGIEPSSELDEIKRAYRALARKYHPDGNNPNASELLFRQVSEAYSTLSSAERRERYDATLGIDLYGRTPEDKKKTRAYVFAAEEEAPEGGIPEYQRSGKSSGKTSGRFSKRPDGKSSAAHESDFEQEDDDGILSKLTRAFTGTRASASEGRPEKAPSEASTGSHKRDDLDLRGDRVYNFTIDAFESLQGTSRELALRSQDMPRMLRVKIPAGVCDGDILRVKVLDEGEERSVPIRVTIAPHEFVEREGRDIVLKMPLTFGEALNGVELEIPTLTAPVKVRVPPLWDVRKRLRVKGRGISREGGEPGDLYVELQIVSPDEDPPQVRQIATALDGAYALHPRNRFPKKF